MLTSRDTQLQILLMILLGLRKAVKRHSVKFSMQKNIVNFVVMYNVGSPGKGVRGHYSRPIGGDRRQWPGGGGI